MICRSKHLLLNWSFARRVIQILVTLKLASTMLLPHHSVKTFFRYPMAYAGIISVKLIKSLIYWGNADQTRIGYIRYRKKEPVFRSCQKSGCTPVLRLPHSSQRGVYPVFSLSAVDISGFLQKGQHTVTNLSLNLLLRFTGTTTVGVTGSNPSVMSTSALPGNIYSTFS